MGMLAGRQRLLWQGTPDYNIRVKYEKSREIANAKNQRNFSEMI